VQKSRKVAARVRKRTGIDSVSGLGPIRVRSYRPELLHAPNMPGISRQCVELDRRNRERLAMRALIRARRGGCEIRPPA